MRNRFVSGINKTCDERAGDGERRRRRKDEIAEELDGDVLGPSSGNYWCHMLVTRGSREGGRDIMKIYKELKGHGVT